VLELSFETAPPRLLMSFIRRAAPTNSFSGSFGMRIFWWTLMCPLAFSNPARCSHAFRTFSYPIGYDSFVIAHARRLSPCDASEPWSGCRLGTALAHFPRFPYTVSCGRGTFSTRSYALAFGGREGATPGSQFDGSEGCHYTRCLRCLTVPGDPPCYRGFFTSTRCL